MRISDTIESAADWPLWAISITENSPRKWVRVCGVMLCFMTFVPLLLVWILVAGALCIPAMFQDA